MEKGLDAWKIRRTGLGQNYYQQIKRQKIEH